MRTGTVVGIVVLVLIVILGAYFLLNADNDADVMTGADNGANMNDGTDREGEPPAAGFPAEDNAIVAQAQRPGTAVSVALVQISEPGFVVVHEDNNGQPGAILGASQLLPEGDIASVGVVLSRPMQAGETFFAMLHFDTDGNGSFSAAADQPVPSDIGGAIQMRFEVSSTAPTGTPVSI